MDEKALAQAHDHYFKRLLEQPGIVRALLREHLPPKIAAELSDEEPELVPGSFISEQLRETQSDRLYRVRLKGGRELLVYCLIEHKSAPDPGIGVQLLGYQTSIWQGLEQRLGLREKLPGIVVLVVYHGATRWPGPERFSERIDADPSLRTEMLDFPFTVLDLGHIPPARLSSDRHLRGGLLVLRYAFRAPPGDRMERLIGMFEDLHGLPVPFIDTTLIYIRSYLGFEEREIKVAIHKTMPDIEEMLEHLAIQKAWAEGRHEGRNEGRNEGITEGLAKGRNEGLTEGIAMGRNEGRVESLLRLIERKFGAPPTEYREQLARAAPDEIDRWFDRLLDASSLDELFRDAAE